MGHKKVLRAHGLMHRGKQERHSQQENSLWDHIAWNSAVIHELP
jgi:hypothetical protein